MCGRCNSSPSFSTTKASYWQGCCEFTPGYYCVWDRTMMALECEDWAELCDLRRVIRQVAHIAFGVVSERQRARTALNNLKRESPFKMCKRFPVSKIYVNLSCSIYANLFQNILSALDIKDRESEKEMKYSRNMEQADSGQTARNDYSIDDAKTQFRNNLKTLENELCKLNETYDRVYFEEKYSLTWCIGECPDLDSPNSKPGKPDKPKPRPPPQIPPTPPDNPNEPDDPRTYKALMDRLRKIGLDPQDFEVLSESKMTDTYLSCDLETQTLGPNLEKRRLPDFVSVVYVFADAEYQQCDEGKVMGYAYFPTDGKMLGPMNLLTWNRSGKWPNSRLKRSPKVKDLRQEYRRDNIDNEVLRRRRGEDRQMLIKQIVDLVIEELDAYGDPDHDFVPSDPEISERVSVQGKPVEVKPDVRVRFNEEQIEEIDRVLETEEQRESSYDEI